MALKVAPTVTERMAGIPVTLNQLEAALYTLAPAVGEEDWEGVTALIERAISDLTTGSSRMPALPAALMSHGLTGSYVAGLPALDAAFAMSGAVVRAFEHNAPGGRHYPLFEKLSLHAHPVAPDLYLLIIHEDKQGFGSTLEADVAKALDIERALKSITVSFPIEVVNLTQFRFDIEPFIDALHRLGIGPIEYADSRDMTGEAAATCMVQRIGRGESENGNTPILSFETPRTLGLQISLGAWGCNFASYDRWAWGTERRTVHCQLNGTVFTGPIKYDFVRTTELEVPTMQFELRRPSVVHDGDPAWPEMATPELKAPARQLAADLVRILT